MQNQQTKFQFCHKIEKIIRIRGMEMENYKNNETRNNMTINLICISPNELQTTYKMKTEMFFLSFWLEFTIQSEMSKYRLNLSIIAQQRKESTGTNACNILYCRI